MDTVNKALLGAGILVAAGLLFAVLLVAVRRGQKTSSGTPPREFTPPTCPKCGSPLTPGETCPKCGSSTGRS